MLLSNRERERKRDIEEPEIRAIFVTDLCKALGAMRDEGFM